MKRLILVLAFMLCGCDQALVTPPLFNKVDKVKVAIVDNQLQSIGIVLGSSRGNNFSIGWSYKIMFADVEISYTEEKLLLYERMKWSDEKSK